MQIYGKGCCRMAGMTARQQRFCEEYLTCLNATQAAIKAGYSEKYAGQNADKLLKNTNVKEYLDTRLKEKESELIADQDEVLRYLTAVMRREKTDSVVVTLKKETSKYVPDEEGKMRKQTVKEEVPQIVKIPAQLRDSNKAAELLGRAYGIYTDRVETDIVLPIFGGEDELED